MRRLSLALALVLASCSNEVTQVVVTIDAESSWLSEPTSLRVVVRGAAAEDATFGSPSRDVTLMLGAGQTYAFPVDVTVAPLDGDVTRRWSVDATATNSVTSTTATVRVRGLYVAHGTLRISLLLENACAGVVCGGDQTCRGGVCVDSAVSTGTDGGIPGDSGTPLHCPSPDVRTPNASAGTLDTGGTSPTYPALVACPSDHDIDESCIGAPGICYSARDQGGLAFCRTPCSVSDVSNSVCAAIHPDSRCVPVVGLSNEPDRTLCSIPCNPFDDVGCPQGLHCVAAADSSVSSFHSDCKALDTDPRHYLEPCTIVEGGAYPSATGCAPGYTCGFDSICGGETSGYVCVQICDPGSEDRVLCPQGSSCFRLDNGTYNDAIGPIRLGRCGPQ